ncbi:putative MFS family arabinose efflux permease [Kribbella amoyensis]|uniref:Putative MFS family arabinose efflux permease n=1 Tax=Kribbella amoyensis TaxID=996641 RepID=A0A561B7V1_9ACTN|nr:MFS transporter [Kribbella amoyensis]TWD74857.1 putative MFS family arabinose efflux permease [Kribbella amoyensis]
MTTLDLPVSATTRPRRALSRRAGFWTAAAVAGISLWTSAAPTTTYPLYASTWHLTPTATTAIFAVYPVVLVVFLLIFGQLSDYIGRRATMLYGVAALLGGVLLFAVAPSVGWVYAGRALMGAGVGLALTPATAAAVEFSAHGKAAKASSVTTAATAVGLALATVVGGGLIEYAPAPLHLDFWVLLAVIAIVFGFVWRMPRHTKDESQGRWRPRAITVPKGLRVLYAAAAVAVTTAYAFGSVFLALGAEVIRDLVGTTNIFVIGLLLAIFSVATGVTAIVGRRFPAARLVTVGAVLTLVDLGLLELSATAHSLPVFLATAIVGGTSYGLLFSGGLSLIATRAPAHHRGGTVAAVYLVAYVLQGAIAVTLGLVATAAGLSTALLLGVTVIGTLALLVIVAAGILARGHRRLPEEGR